MSERELEEFPCLENDFRFDDEELYVCVSADNHDGEHDFKPASELMVKLDNTGVQFSLEEQTIQ